MPPREKETETKPGRRDARQGEEPPQGGGGAGERQGGREEVMGWNSTLTRKTPLRAKKPWVRKKPLWLASKSPHDRIYSKPLKRTPLKKVSKSQRRKLKEYYPERAVFLRENQWCVICAVRGTIPPNAATEVHHLRGRAGKLVSDPRFFAASCRDCREWPHANPRAAREAGLLAAPGEWGVRPSA